MPKFSYHVPVSQGDMAAIRKLASASKQSLPLGKIGESHNFSWGYEGNFYYVAEGVFEHLVTRIHLSLEEAKSLFEALVFIESVEPSQQLVSQAINASRKGMYVGDELMWFFVDELSASQ
jgi:hypothetical protein